MTCSPVTARGQGRGTAAAKPRSRAQPLRFPDADPPRTESEHGLRVSAVSLCFSGKEAPLLGENSASDGRGRKQRFAQNSRPSCAEAADGSHSPLLRALEVPAWPASDVPPPGKRQGRLLSVDREDGSHPKRMGPRAVPNGYEMRHLQRPSILHRFTFTNMAFLFQTELLISNLHIQ